MSTTIAGIVRNGVIVPSVSLPEGAFVEIRLNADRHDVSPELQAEFDAWDQASGEALALVERMAEELERDEKR